MLFFLCFFLKKAFAFADSNIFVIEGLAKENVMHLESEANEKSLQYDLAKIRPHSSEFEISKNIDRMRIFQNSNGSIFKSFDFYIS